MDLTTTTLSDSPTPRGSTSPQQRKRRRLSHPAHSAPPLEATFLRLINLLNALEELCAVGTVDFTMPRRGMTGIDAPDGWLWLETPAKKLKGQCVEAWLEALIDRGHVRATYIMTSANTARARIYVLPEDIAKGLLPELDHSHRVMLKRLVGCLNISVQAWKGDPVEAETKINMAPELRETVSPTNEMYYFDAKEIKFFRDPTYPESERRTRYSLRRSARNRMEADEH
ncbi:hypothetical protein EV426DRAFT_700703 [Tirmania nivea]|nr:hypothetical protein EV426DRAFT_700703 [Tirmania nivea]